MIIGVIASEDQRELAKELFQLFKTPYEFADSDALYSVVVVFGKTTGKIPNASLTIVFSEAAEEQDNQLGIALARMQSRFLESPTNGKFPVYTCLSELRASGQSSTLLSANGRAVAVQVVKEDQFFVRVGYNLLSELQYLLTVGQPVENAEFAPLDSQITCLRSWIVELGLPLVEIAPSPAGYEFGVSLTHDIDFVGIRQHRWDHSLAGFLHRATIGSALRFVKGRMTLGKVLECWLAVAKVPLIHLGMARDFWLPFEWYLKVEKGLNPTYYFIPFKRRAGAKVPASGVARRATAYDISDIPNWIQRLQAEDCEIGVHGIDAWHDSEEGKRELEQVKQVCGNDVQGIRMHWLLRDEETYRILEGAGYGYDSTCGYNETIGFRAGTAQVFKPLNANQLLEIPMHIQDGALFYPTYLDLNEDEAQRQCNKVIESVAKHGGVLTLLWHDRSHGPERFWGEFYARLLNSLKEKPVWFASAGTMVAWFRNRRQISFRRRKDLGLSILPAGAAVAPGFKVITYNIGPGENRNVIEWNGAESLDIFAVRREQFAA